MAERHPIEDRDFTSEEMKDPHRYSNAFDKAYPVEEIQRQNAGIERKLERLEIEYGAAGRVASFGQLIASVIGRLFGRR